LDTRQRPVGWQPSPFHSDRSESERAFKLSEQLGSVNVAAAELGTNWPSLRKAITATGPACPPPTPRPSVSAPWPPLLLDGELRIAEPKTLRHWLWHVAARVVRHARRMILRLQRSWP
jgi:hypothetical protein